MTRQPCFWRSAGIGVGLLATVVCSRVVLGQIKHERIAGLVTTDSGTVISRATVIVTRGPDRAVFTSNTDSAGKFQVDIPSGSGDYLLYISAPGSEPFRKRLTFQAGDSIVELSVKLQLKIQQLGSVRVIAPAERPMRGPTNQTETGGIDHFADGVASAVDPRDNGDISSVAAVVPGVTLTREGASVLGLPPSQNQVTLNGLSFSGRLPREARSRTRVYTSSYDPARGGFSGAQIDAELSPGGEFSFARSRLTLDAPAIQFGGPSTTELGQSFSKIDVGVGGDGQLSSKLFLNTGAQISRSWTGIVPLSIADRVILSDFGVARDSIQRLLHILSASGLGSNPLGRAPKSSSTEARLLARIDHLPFETRVGSESRQTWGITGYGQYGVNDVPGNLGLINPSQEARQTSLVAQLQGAYANYWGRDYLTETKSSFSYTANTDEPGTSLPAGVVTISSMLEEGQTFLSSLPFGGTGSPPGNDRLLAWENTSETLFYGKNSGAHRVKLYAFSRLAGRTESTLPNGLGTFSYGSLADLENNQPSSFSRALGQIHVRGGDWATAFGAGDLWKRSARLTVLYGARIDGFGFLNAPRQNPALERLFNRPNKERPSAWHLSPRVGFTWIRGGQDRASAVTNPIATIYRGSVGALRGGVGRFQSRLPDALLTDAYRNTGLSNSTSQLLCVGPATPQANWASFESNPESIPTSCAGALGEFTRRAPSVYLFDKSFDAPFSWRGNLTWTSNIKAIEYSLEGVYSLNLNQPGIVDLNFLGTPRLNLTNEENRPLFVPAESIDPSTGKFIDTNARGVSDFGRVISHRSDNRSISRRLILTLTLPPTPKFANLLVRTSYVLSNVSYSARGFDRVNGGDPTRRTWARSDLDIRHRLQLESGISNKWFGLSVFGRVSSGFPYTPLVNGDVNGDGSAYNDAAYIFSNTIAADSATATGIQTLLKSSQAARECLGRQLNTIAKINGCDGPWTFFLNGQASAGQKLIDRVFGKNSAATVSVFLNNPLGGVDYLIHGSRVRGWGSANTPDPILLRVNGFNTTDKHFRYEVNGQFASPTASASLRNPFRLTVDVSIPLSRSLPEQQIAKWLKPGRGRHPGVRLNADSLRKRYRRSVPDIYQGIINLADSLLITRDQLDTLQKRHAPYLQRMDSLWTDVSTRLATLPDNFSTNEALIIQESGIDQGWEIARQEAKTLGSVLRPIQIRLLPWPSRMLFNAERPLHGLRVYMP